MLLTQLTTDLSDFIPTNMSVDACQLPVFLSASKAQKTDERKLDS
jgi:hypothetical protein